MTWHVEIDNSVAKILKHIPQKDAERLQAVLDDFQLDPYTGDIIKLSGEENSWRRRIGSYRIFFELFPKERIVLIQQLQRRGSKTY